MIRRWHSFQDFFSYLNKKDEKWLEKNVWFYKKVLGLPKSSFVLILYCISVGWFAPLLLIGFSFATVDIIRIILSNPEYIGDIALYAIFAVFCLMSAILFLKYQIRLLKILLILLSSPTKGFRPTAITTPSTINFILKESQKDEDASVDDAVSPNSLIFSTSADSIVLLTCSYTYQYTIPAIMEKRPSINETTYPIRRLLDGYSRQGNYSTKKKSWLPPELKLPEAIQPRLCCLDCRSRIAALWIKDSIRYGELSQASQLQYKYGNGLWEEV